MHWKIATQNLAPAQVKAALDDPERTLLLIPFLGGEHFNSRNADACENFTKALLPITGQGGAVVSPPRAAATPTKRPTGGDAKYAFPLPYLVNCATPEIAKKILRHHALCINRSSPHTSSGGRRPALVDARPLQVPCQWRQPRAFALLLRRAAAEATFTAGPIRSHIIRLTQGNGKVPADTGYTSSCVPWTSSSCHTKMSPSSVLYGRPCTTDFEQWEALRDTFRNMSFVAGFTEFTPIGAVPRHLGRHGSRPPPFCWICKLDEHRSKTCPFRSLHDWMGPIAAYDDTDGTNRAPANRNPRPYNQGGYNQGGYNQGGFHRPNGGYNGPRYNGGRNNDLNAVEYLPPLNILLAHGINMILLVPGFGDQKKTHMPMCAAQLRHIYRPGAATSGTGNGEGSKHYATAGSIRPGVRRPAVLAVCLDAVLSPKQTAECPSPTIVISSPHPPITDGPTGTANMVSMPGGSGGPTADRHLHEERYRLEGGTTAAHSEGNSDRDFSNRDRVQNIPNDESAAGSSVQERIVVNAGELQAPHRLTSRDLVPRDEDTAGVHSAAGAINQPVQGNMAAIANALQAQVRNNSPTAGSPRRDWSHLPPVNETEEERNARYARDWEAGLAELRRPPPEPTGAVRPAPEPPPMNERPPALPQRANPGRPAGPPRRRRIRGKKTTKAAIKIGALNIRGTGDLNSTGGNNKWLQMNRVMNENKLGITLFAKLTSTERGQKASKKYSRGKWSSDTLETPDPECRWYRIHIKQEPEVKQHDGKILSILGVYAPNVSAENAEFWKKIQVYYETHNLPKPDLMGGDTNIVEDAIDRLPAHTDPDQAVEALDDLKSYLGLVDGW
ncbi:hypothetical protein R3P38DRAFT_3239460, partial [Favolaschia claudopus]